MSVGVTKRVSFQLNGRPIAKGRPKTTMKSGKPVTFTPSRTRAYERMVVAAIRYQLPDDVLEGEHLSVEISISTKRRLTGDLDNYAKAILDAIVTSGLIVDDNRIDHLSVSRVVVAWADDRTYVEIAELT